MPRKRPKPHSAGEVLNDLSRDPNWVTAGLERELQTRTRSQRHIEDSSEITKDLHSLGFDVEVVSDLYNKKLDYRAAIPLLLRWLPRVSNPRIKEEIVRALSVKWAKPIAARPLIEEFISAPSDCHSLKWAIGNALDVVADDSVARDLIHLAEDKNHAADRQMVVLALKNIRDPNVVPVLRSLLNDDDVKGHAVEALAKLRVAPSAARDDLEKLVDVKPAWIARAARKALRRIDARSKRTD